MDRGAQVCLRWETKWEGQLQRSVITYRVSVESKVSVGQPFSRAWLLHDPHLDLLHSCAAPAGGS